MPQAVELAAEPGLTLRGQHWDRGPNAAVLVHRPGGDLDRWRYLAHSLDQVGLSTLTFDLRGHGLSDGAWTDDALHRDIATAIKWLRERHPGLCILIAEGRGADECLTIADEGEIAALILISPSRRPSHGGRESACPKLLAVGGQDEESLAIARDVYNHVVGPRLLIDLPTSDQGADLFDGISSVRLLESINVFLAVDLGLTNRREVAT